jgi:hypothetical protein
MPIEISGLKELRAELKALDRAVPRELNAALKEGAKVVTARAVQLAPQGKTGNLKGSGRPFSNASGAGVRFSVPYAGVQEFATSWQRRSRAGKPETVHYRKDGPPPRFAYKAINELGDGLVADTFDRILGVLRCHGWFR